MKSKKLQTLMSQLEQLEETASGKLQGGFSGIGAQVVSLCRRKKQKM